jgi:hypothetical protein
MIHKIDWFSYTFESGDLPDMAAHRLRQILVDRLPEYINRAFVNYDMPVKRKGFSVGVSIGKHTYCFIATNGRILIEHTGQGCTLLEQENYLLELITERAERATRIDIATDIMTNTKPKEFVAVMGGGKTSSRGNQESVTGDTEYIGSEKSDRWCKVYRYHKPHPRHKFLRIEYTYKGKQAKIAAASLAQISVGELAIMSGNRYKWGHKCYKPDEGATDAILGAWRPERKQGSTARWLLAQAAPSLAKMVHNDELSLDDFLTEYHARLDELNKQKRLL